MSTDTIAALEEELAQLEAEVANLVDLEAIYRLRNTYYAHVNESRFDQLPALFTENATADFGNELGKRTGRGDIAEAIASLGDDAFVQLFPHGHVVDLAGDSATGHLYVEGRLIEGGESFITMGKATDRYARVNGRWLIDATEFKSSYATPLAVGWAVADPVKPFKAP